ncbi:MAG: epoxide hydrolase family protein [Gammaproteobacteria bacterium]
MSTAIRPFRIEIPEAALQDLKQRLANTRWPERETVVDWTQGIPLSYVQELCAYWRDSYDWRAREALLNARPQFLTEVDGLDIHFMHIRSPEAGARPLVLTHGWPGSIVEFAKVIDALADPARHGGDAADAFHLVIPALPGYGFSGKPAATGWKVERIADAWSVLMQRLGYDRYFAQGGDWGSAVTTAIGARDPVHCMGIHVNLALGQPRPEQMNDLTDFEKSALAAAKFYEEWDSGYSKQQCTRPQTVGYGLADSPSGQLAWIVEKFYFWTDCNGHPENVLARDEILDNVMLYWLTNAGASSARLYWESMRSGFTSRPSVPSGVSIFPKEIFRASRRWVENAFSRLVYYNELDKGGHFAAFEQPGLFVQEVRNCFRLMR